MERKETFLHAFNALTRSYLDGTLFHADCSACAVGNIVQQPALFKMFRQGEDYIKIDMRWYIQLCDHRRNERNSSDLLCGYTFSEIDRIEAAFESAEPYHNADPDGYKGLIAVLDVLFSIHKVDNEEGEPLRSAFLKEEVIA
jgi:hypothetical protein